MRDGLVRNQENPKEYRNSRQKGIATTPRSEIENQEEASQPQG